MQLQPEEDQTVCVGGKREADPGFKGFLLTALQLETEHRVKQQLQVCLRARVFVRLSDYYNDKHEFNQTCFLCEDGESRRC